MVLSCVVAAAASVFLGCDGVEVHPVFCAFWYFNVVEVACENMVEHLYYVMCWFYMEWYSKFCEEFLC